MVRCPDSQPWHLRPGSLRATHPVLPLGRGRLVLRHSLAGWGLWFCLAAPLAADYRNSFESAEVSWRLADADCPVRLVAHQRDSRVAHSGHSSEQLSIAAGRGTYVYLIHNVDHARVIAELKPSLWVRADRPGMQLMVRVVLPRARDPRTGAALTTLLRGDIYDRTGSWQQLWLHRPDQLLERQVRVLRSEFGSGVDDREAYLDLVVLNAYGGVGTSNLWLDDLEITGHVAAVQFANTDRGAGATAAPPQPTAGEVSPARRGSSEVRLNGSVLIADGVPLFPRAVEACGEPLEWLKSLGFNAIRLAAAPTAVQLHEAERLGLWLIAPPPHDGQINDAHQRVLAWDLGSGLGDLQLELTRQRVAALRQADPRPDRPLIAEASERLWNYSRLTSFLVLRDTPLGTSQSLPRYGQWLQQRPTLARPGTPFWAVVQTEPPPALVDQWSALGLGPPLSLAVEPEQIRQLAYQTLASGARGLIFASRAPLDRSDADTQGRARILKQLNLELQAIEPWAAAGTRQGDVDSGRSDVWVSSLQTERAQLLMILSQDPHQQMTRGPSAPGPLSIVVPSTVNSPQVYRLTPGGLRTMTHRRVAGGIRLTLDPLGQINLVAIAQDPLVLNHLARTLAATRADVAGLYRDTAAGELAVVESIHQRAAGALPPSAADAWLAQARSSLRHCELLLGASDHGTAYDFAEKTLESLSHVRRAHWQSAAGTFASQGASPYCVHLPAIPLHWDMARRLQAAPSWSANLLPAGDFENLEHLRATGWQNYAAPSRDLVTAVELNVDAPHGGGAALRMSAAGSGSGQPPTAFETPPVTIVSAPVSVRRGQLLRISGWARIPHPIQGSPDGLKIYDSISGAVLCLRLYEAQGWQQFALYRAAVEDSAVELTFELTGLGEAWIDDVEISVHESIGDRYPAGPWDEARTLPAVAETFH